MTQRVPCKAEIETTKHHIEKAERATDLQKAAELKYGKLAELEKLAGSLLVDSSKIRNLLGWRPPFTLEEGIRETVRGM